tara:strand:+ start:355 stop:492 length:138 start_codon:yes stop_codon:yes gene_type:complete
MEVAGDGLMLLAYGPLELTPDWLFETERSLLLLLWVELLLESTIV